MKDSLDTVKRRISAKYLGKCGIHGVGLSRSANAICIYLDKQSDELTPCLKELKLDATPFQVLTFREERARQAEDVGGAR